MQHLNFVRVWMDCSVALDSYVLPEQLQHLISLGLIERTLDGSTDWKINPASEILWLEVCHIQNASHLDNRLPWSTQLLCKPIPYRLRDGRRHFTIVPIPTWGYPLNS